MDKSDFWRGLYFFKVSKYIEMPTKNKFVMSFEKSLKFSMFEIPTKSGSEHMIDLLQSRVYG